MTAASGRRLVVFFDRDCGLCQATGRALDRWDRRERLEILALQDAAGSVRAAVAAVAAENRLASTLHVLDEATGTVERGGDAALAIASELPGRTIVRPLRRLPPFRWVIGVMYELVARHRHAIGRRLGVEGHACDTPR